MSLQNTYTKKSILFRCLAVLLIGILFSFFTVTAFAASVTGDSWAFTLGSKDYLNYSGLSYISSYGWLTGSTTADCQTSTCASGYLGAKPNIYKENSSGTYSLVGAGVWQYSTRSCWAYTNGTTSYDDPETGYYICQGQSAVYYDGSYQRNLTYGTPLIQVD